MLSVKKRVFRVSMPGRDDYLVVDVSAAGVSFANVFLIVSSTQLADENFAAL